MGQGIIFQNKKILDPLSPNDLKIVFFFKIYLIFLILFDHCFYPILNIYIYIYIYIYMICLIIFF